LSADFGDEFVVDLSFDERYGTVVFDTVAGLSKCPHEKGTAANEDPGIVISPGGKPSPFIFPDDPMVFQVDLTNVGQGNFSTFLLTATQGESNLGVTVDGASLRESGIPFTIAKDSKVTKQITVRRGPQLYRDDAITLYLRSQCG